MVNQSKMLAQLILHEGVRLHYYEDTEGYTTVGVGFNVSARGVTELERLLGRPVNAAGEITRAEALSLLSRDIVRVEKATRVAFPEYDKLDEVRQRVCVDLAFNIGFRALAFKNCIAAVRARDWSTAARELYKSKWAYQVGDGPGGKFDRADRLSFMILTGQDRPELASV